MLHQQSVELSSLSALDKDVDILAAKVAGGRAASTRPWCAAAGTWVTAPTSRPMSTKVRPSADAAEARFEEDRPGPEASHSAEAAVLEAFIVQHYVGQPVPPQLVTSHAVSSELIDALGAASGVRVRASTSRASSAASGWRWRRKAPSLAGGCCAPGGPAAAAARALIEAAGPRYRRSCRAASTNASTSATPPVKRRKLLCVVFEVTRCRQRHTAASTSKASPAATTTRHARGADAALCAAGRGRLAAGRAGHTAGRRSSRPAANSAEREIAKTATAAKPRRGPRRACLTWCWWDGGCGQVAMAREVFEELELDISLIVGVRAKGARSAWRNWSSPTAREKGRLGHDSAAL
ncbi:MAG: hypothetical protein IPJ42_00020 [Betaproteobacteria bacterium]|nr:hypothetical protein [Betaproteobacteria bacterium]